MFHNPWCKYFSTDGKWFGQDRPRGVAVAVSWPHMRHCPPMSGERLSTYASVRLAPSFAMESTMRNLRLACLAWFSPLLIPLFAIGTNNCLAQMAPGQGAGQQNQAQTGPPVIVAAPGATVAAPAPAGAASSPGLIVAAKGSTVVVQSPAAPSTKPSTPKPNNFSTPADTSTITTLGYYAANKDANGNSVTKPYPVLARAGAIDALGSIGGIDQTTIDAIVKGLSSVLDMEFINNNLSYKDASGPGSSEFLCYHVVLAIGNLGWGGRAAIPQIMLLRGQNVLLDAAIDHTISAVQLATPPPATAASKNTTGTGTGSRHPHADEPRPMIAMTRNVQ